MFAMVEHMAEAPFKVLATLAQQRFAALARDSLFGLVEHLPDDCVLFVALAF
jgi:hypothetical protein